MVGRPRKAAKCSKRSISLSPEATEIIERGGYQTNLSAFIDGLIRHTSADSPIFIAIRIERLSKDIAVLQEKAASATLERDILQAQLNLYNQRSPGVDDKQRSTRTDLLRKWEASAGNAGMFVSWLTGPANICMIRDAGFASADEAAEWCRTESRRR